MFLNSIAWKTEWKFYFSKTLAVKSKNGLFKSFIVQFYSELEA